MAAGTGVWSCDAGVMRRVVGLASDGGEAPTRVVILDLKWRDVRDVRDDDLPCARVGSEMCGGGVVKNRAQHVSKTQNPAPRPQVYVTGARCEGARRPRSRRQRVGKGSA